MNYWENIESLIRDYGIPIDRKKGTSHPKYKEMIYPVDYGYINNTTAIDNNEIDIFTGTKKKEGINGIMNTVDMKKKDAETKVIYNCTKKEIKEILRTKNAYLTEKELSEFNTMLSRSANETPLDVFVKNWYLTQDTQDKIPAWLLLGFEELIERDGLPENTSASMLIRKTLSDILKTKGINKEVIATRAKLKLKSEWQY